MASSFMDWVRQDSTRHGLGVLAFAVGSGIASTQTGNPKADLLIGAVSYALVHLGINDPADPVVPVAVQATKDAVQAVESKQLPPAVAVADVVSLIEALDRRSQKVSP